MAANYKDIGRQFAPSIGAFEPASSTPPAFTPRGLWFSRVIWWPVVMAGGSTFLAGCTALLTR
jgi:hypothetical protein